MYVNYNVMFQYVRNCSVPLSSSPNSTPALGHARIITYVRTDVQQPFAYAKDARKYYYIHNWWGILISVV